MQSAYWLMYLSEILKLSKTFYYIKMSLKTGNSSENLPVFKYQKSGRITGFRFSKKTGDML